MSMPVVKSCMSSRGVVLVGDLACGGLVAVEHVEIAAHRGGEGDVIHDGGEVGEGIFCQDVLIGRDRAGVDGVGGDDEDLRESEGDALAKLVWAGEHRLPPLGLLARDEIGGGADGSGGGGDVGQDSLRGVELLGDVGVDADLLDVLDVGEGRAEGGLIEDACGCSDGGVDRIDGGGGRRRWGVAGGRIDDGHSERGGSGGDDGGCGEFRRGDEGSGDGGSGDLDLRAIDEAGADHVEAKGGGGAALSCGGGGERGDRVQKGFGEGSRS